MVRECDEGNYTRYLEQWPYRSLQQTAKALELPSNVKKIQLIQLIYAKKFKSSAEVEGLAMKIRIQRKQLAAVRKRAVKTPKKKSLQQSSEISSTSNSKSPPICSTPKRSCHMVIRYSSESKPKYTRPDLKPAQPTESINKSISVLKSDRVLRSYKGVKKPNFVVNSSVIGIIESSSTDQAKETSGIRVNILKSDNYPKVDMASHVTRQVDQWKRAELVPVTSSVHTSPPPCKRQRTVSGIYPLNREDVKLPRVSGIYSLNREDAKLPGVSSICPLKRVDVKLPRMSGIYPLKSGSVKLPRLSGIYPLNREDIKLPGVSGIYPLNREEVKLPRVSGIYSFNRDDVKLPHVSIRRPDGTLSKINVIVQKPFTQLNRNNHNQIVPVTRRTAPMPNLTGLAEILKIDNASYKENEFTNYCHKKIRAEQIRQKSQVYSDEYDGQVYKTIGDCQVYKSTGGCRVYKGIGDSKGYRSNGDSQVHKRGYSNQMYRNMEDHQVYRKGNDHQVCRSEDVNQVHRNMGDHRVYKSCNDKQVYKSMEGNQVNKSGDENQKNNSVSDNQVYKIGDENQMYKTLGDDQLYKSIDENQMYKSVGDNQVNMSRDENQTYESVGDKQMYMTGDEDQIYNSFEDAQVYNSGDENQSYKSEGNNQVYTNGDENQMYKSLGDNQVSKSKDDNQMYKSFGSQVYTSVEDNQIYGSQNDNQLYSGVRDSQIYRVTGDNQMYKSIANSQLYGGNGDSQVYQSGDDSQVFRSSGDNQLFNTTAQRLPRIGDVFSRCQAVYRNVTEPIYVKVDKDAEMTQPPVDTTKPCVLEQIYNLKNVFVSKPPLLQVCTTANTRCVYSTPLITTAKAQPSISAVSDELNLASVSHEGQYGIDMDPIPRVQDFFRSFTCDDDAVSQTSQDANVTIPEMVEDALELISQDGDYMERIGMDVRVRCIICAWAGPKIILEYHIRKEHPSDIVNQESSEWVSTFCLGALATGRAWASAVSDSAGRLYAVSAAYHQPDCFMAIISNISETDTPKLASLTIYNKVTGEPYTWQGEILPLSDTMPYETEVTCLKLELSQMDLLPNSANLKLLNGELVPKSPSNVVVGQPELDNIYIAVNVQLLN